MPEVRVGIVSWNTAELLDDCLRSLPAALGDLDAEVVVVDNASADGSVAVAQAHEGVRVIEQRSNEGYARGMNRALSGEPVPPVLIALNPDTVSPPGSLAKLVADLRADPVLAVVAPRLTTADGTTAPPSAFPFPSVRGAIAQLLPPRVRSRLARWGLGPILPPTTGRVDWAMGTVHVLRTSWTGPRPYSERWFMYAEDIDLCWRMREAGAAVHFVDEVAIVHIGNASGVQRWGPDREPPWRATSCDWYARTHGPWRARAYATAHLLAALAHGVRLMVRNRPGDRVDGRRRLRSVRVYGRGIRRPGGADRPD